MRDVNGTRAHLVLGEHDWLPRIAAGSGLDWEARSACVTLEPLPAWPRQPKARPLGRRQRRGAGRDGYGNVYWIGEGRDEIRYLPAGTYEAGRLWPAKELFEACEPAAGSDFLPCPRPVPAALPVLSGLAVTRCHYLVAGTRGRGGAGLARPAGHDGLLLFDLHGGGPATWLRWPEALDFAPFDLAPAADGGLWVLDVAAAHTRLWRLDRWLAVVPPADSAAPARRGDFRAADGGDAGDRQAPAPGLSADLAVPLAPASVAVEALPDGSALVLESDPALSYSRVVRFLDGERVGEASLEGVLTRVPGGDGGTDVAGHDFAFLAEPAERGMVRGALHVAARSGQQVFVVDLEAGLDGLSLDVRPRFYPLRQYGGKALIAGAGDAYYDFGERWLPVAEQPRRRFVEKGTIDGLVFDGRQPGTVWHRVMLDACVPDEGALAVASRSADQRAELAGMPFEREPAPHLRPSGSELPFQRPWHGRQGAPDGTGTWELLLQGTAGRFLELRLTVSGNGRRTPRLRALRLYYPRFSYLGEYLPGVYRQDAVAASFLDRFLANPEGLYTALEGRIEHAETLFDARTAPREYLEWLAGWLGAVLDPEWGEARRRLFLAHAAELFRWRGTPAGLLAALRLAVDPCPGERIFASLPGCACDQSLDGAGVRVVERFLTRRLPAVALGDATEPEAPGPGLVLPEEPWRPAHGAGALHRAYRRFLAGRYDAGTAPAIERLAAAWQRRLSSFEQVTFEPLTPPEPAAGDDRAAFIRGLGFHYAEVGAGDAAAFRGFLRRRYRRIESLNRAYQKAEGSALESFDGVALPAVLPEQQAALTDWIHFVSLALPLRRNAHRFTVLIPAWPGEAQEQRQRRRALAEEVVRRQKPAHAAFEVKLYWALFQVGAARLGLDTVVGEGSRFVALALGEGYLGDSFLAGAPAAEPPWCSPGRATAGCGACAGISGCKENRA